MRAARSGRLLSVNVGLPKNIDWRGRVVHTGIWKYPLPHRCRVGRLNLEGDGQGDLSGHGGEQRAVFVYQIESYRHWEEHLGRSDFTPGQFGENFTIEGLPDDEVCIGDRFEIGSALFEVTQPRVTCYRVGIRLNEPRMPALLTSSGRPGFYFRVLREGEVGDGDAIVKVGEAEERMTVAAVNALLYSSSHPPEEITRALKIEALSPGWRASFEALRSGGSGNAGLVPGGAAHPASPGFLSLEVANVRRESVDVISFTLRQPDKSTLATPLAGQFVVLRMRSDPNGSPLYRSYSLSSAPSSDAYRISVKIEPNGKAGAYLSNHVRAGDRIDVSSPRGSFVLGEGDGPIALLSAGIGVTPVLAMLHTLAVAASPRDVWWVHGARNGDSHPFAAESRRLVKTLTRGRAHVLYSRPNVGDRLGQDFDSAGRLTVDVLERLGIPRDADVYLCGPSSFMDDFTRGLGASGVSATQIHTEIFSGGNPITPGVIGKAMHAPHLPPGARGSGPLVSFGRSGVAVRWKPEYQSLLELAEACDVPVRWSCRTGVCHTCESGLVSGAVAYDPDPLDAPADGNVLICCSRPRGDVVVDI